MCEAFPHLLEEATRAIRERAFSFAAQQVNVAKAQLDKNASTIGAAVLVMEKFFANPLQYLEYAAGAVSH